MNKFIIKCALLVLVALCPCLASAQDYYATQQQPEGNGTLSKPYQMASLENFLWLAAQVNGGYDQAGKYFEMTQDIDFAPTKTWDGGRGWASIGGLQSFEGIVRKMSFRGYFDGKGHTIGNLYINRKTDFQGLFGYVFAGSVKNLNLKDAHIEGTENLGVLAGYTFEEEVVNCHVWNSTVTASGVYAGGLMGFQKEGITQDCSADAQVSGFDYLGGLTSWCLEGEIKHCFTSGKITSIKGMDGSEPRMGRLAGGLVGYLSQSKLSQSMSTVQLEGGNQMGGLVGVTVKSTVETCGAISPMVKGITYVGGFVGKNEETAVTNCFARSIVEGDASVGGFIGSLDYTGSNITNCYAAGKVSTTGTEGTTGGFVGNKSYTTAIKNCYHDKDASTQAEAVGGFAHNNCDCKDMTTAQMKTQTTFAGWDFAKTWSINATENDGYPMLREMSTSAVKTITAISSAVKVWRNGPMYIIDSPQAGIEAVNVFDLSGHKVAQVAGLGQNTLTLNLPANGSIMIVTCTLSNGQTASIKVMP